MHDKLLDKLHHYGIDNNINKWIGNLKELFEMSFLILSILKIYFIWSYIAYWSWIKYKNIKKKHF